MSNSWKRRLAAGAASVALAGGIAVTAANVAVAEEAPVSVAGVCDGNPGCQLGPYSSLSSCQIEQSNMARYYTITMRCFEVDTGQWKFAYKTRGT
ncbi:hypothetical protein [Amycolatopsis decaplanina]|uniref:Secreted protein n=1 Tax=Amycolatopsis decaplanina DSM 44594 TaxID=1284240 RepID=M2XQJ3_9PSEU|nr:hypothetical protein [Amycolatopsis decaplanina]EME51440.1 hypothetical protein H074_37002 [Amycolatopsis decaplanina DSM 44594]